MAESRKERKIVAVPSHPETVRHLTIAERAARGKAARAEVPRSSQAEVEFPRRRGPAGYRSSRRGLNRRGNDRRARKP